MSDFIPIDTIEPADDDEQSSVVPALLADDPVTSDGSAGRAGVEIGSWRIHTLRNDRLLSVSEPDGHDRYARQARKAHAKSRKARRRRGRTARRWVRALVGFLVVGGIVAISYVGVMYALEMWGGISVPSVMGLSQSAAFEQLTDKGFAVEITTEPADEMDGHVIGLAPDAGTRVPQGSTIHVTVSTSRRVPEVLGMTREEARSALQAAGAQNIRFQSSVQLEEEDKVIEVRPEAGSAFVSTEEVTVVVSQRPLVPDVVGMVESEARNLLDREGVPATTVYEQATEEQRLKVVRTEPAAGASASDEGVTVVVGDPLLEVTHLRDYRDATPSHINEFLQAHGFALHQGYRRDDGHMVASYEDLYGGTVAFLVDPWAQAPLREERYYSEVMLEEGARIEGIRLSVAPVSRAAQAQAEQDWANQGYPTPKGLIFTDLYQARYEPLMTFENPTVGEETALAVMDWCGFSNMVDSCTQETITVPKDAVREGHVFYCCQGEMGADVWTILVRGSVDNGNTATEVVVTLLPRRAYDVIDLEPYDGRICNFVAYQDEYVR